MARNRTGKIGYSLTCLSFLVIGCVDASSIKEGQSLLSVREQLFAEGWRPLLTYERMEDGSYVKMRGDAKKIIEDGLTEVEACSGAGVPYCAFNYTRKGACLKVVTIGQYLGKKHPLAVANWRDVACEELVTKDS